MKQIIYISILLLFISSTTFGQVTLGRQVIGSTGSYFTGTNISVSSTVGEAVVQTLSSPNFILTQGFQQTLKVDSILDDVLITNETCLGAKNGKIEIFNVLGCPPNSLIGGYQIVIYASGDTTFTPLGSDTLSSGNYDVEITGNNGCFYATTIFVGLDSDENCLLKFYSGITPNGDNKNDVWWIDNIELFPENTVQIFNRWGNEVWVGTNYDNGEVIWEGLNRLGAEMPDATYFYVAKITGIDNPFTGWVELTR
jgi:gliding motility-associated-like protein